MAMMNDKLNYSFIIPHRNSPDLLNRCLDSIPQREDIEIIVVDDNSDADKKPKVSRPDVKLIYIDAEHTKGAGRARNYALKEAKGKWLVFADADDYFSEFLPDLLERFANEDAIDIVYLNANKFDQNNNFSEVKESQLIKKYLAKEPNAESRLRYELWTPWSRMVKKEVVYNNQIRFDEIPAANDKMFGLLCSKYSPNIAVEQHIIYHYFRPSYKSQTDKKRNNSMFDTIISVRERVFALYQEVHFSPLPSFIDLIFFSNYSKGISISLRLKKYIKTLNKNNISFHKDFIRYINNKFRIGQ